MRAFQRWSQNAENFDSAKLCSLQRPQPHPPFLLYPEFSCMLSLRGTHLLLPPRPLQLAYLACNAARAL